jgi:hypothetical protein
MQMEPLHITKRVVAIVVPRAPFVEWINAADPSPTNTKITLDDPHHPGKRWIQRNWKAVFEQMLDEWYVDPDLWPRKRTSKMFREWCEVSIHSTVLDCAITPLKYED